METKVFKKRLIPAVLYFELFYFIYFVILIFQGDFTGALTVAAFGLIIYGYLLGFRPSGYSITRKTLEVHYRLRKTKEYNLMSIETISDPAPRLTKIITDPRTLEIYLESGKRVVVSPKSNLEFTSAIVSGNKRVNVQVKEYAQNRRVMEKKQRKERKKEKSA
ncbi:PH domain-containing protein [Tannockella kyphosi]|uniref:PH domain-containing protein n=1 Tax=Tannockella kyphosi TaxID=2899121 RepID=UPI002012EA88|nr:PH domain-containing protein [Tannockella kyphosi]